jgi:hypothetical protein
MFKYNRFWHFWSTLDNRDYLRVVSVAALFAIAAAFFFAPILLTSYLGLLTIVAASSLAVGVVITVLNTLSDFFYSQQNERLQHLQQDTTKLIEKETAEETKQRTLQRFINEQASLYINNRVVAPEQIELIEAAQHVMSTSMPFYSKKTLPDAQRMNPPVYSQHSEELTIEALSSTTNRNQGFIAQSPRGDSLFIKQTQTRFALSEVAAREMADIAGFKGLIPNNTLTTQTVTPTLDSDTLLLSKQKLAEYIRNERKEITHTDNLDKTILKFISQMQQIRYKIQARKNELPTLTYVQTLVHNVKNGGSIFENIFSDDPNARAEAQRTLSQIDMASFQSNFLLELFLGSQDANPGNTLLVPTVNNHGETVLKMQSIDHEQIMPENNYNVTKHIPMDNGSLGITEKPIDNVFPIKLWLAGLPHANLPFSKAVMEHTLSSLDPERILAYHRHKKLFTPTAVAAQLARIKLIRDSFEAECLKPEITLTPKTLFLTLVNNHPSYDFLKNDLGIKSDFLTFMLLGMIPEDANLSILTHPLQYGPIIGKLFEVIGNQQDRQSYTFSEESFQSPYAARCVFFLMAQQYKQLDESHQSTLNTINQQTMDTLLAQHALAR